MIGPAPVPPDTPRHSARGSVGSEGSFPELTPRFRPLEELLEEREAAFAPWRPVVAFLAGGSGPVRSLAVGSGWALVAGAPVLPAEGVFLVAAGAEVPIPLRLALGGPGRPVLLRGELLEAGRQGEEWRWRFLAGRAALAAEVERALRAWGAPDEGERTAAELIRSPADPARFLPAGWRQGRRGGRE
jgi:hypothetical protein